MQAMRIIETTAQQWEIFTHMRGVLLKAGAQHKARQETSGNHAGSNREVSGKSWPGARLGIRQADPDETPLSLDECWIAVREGLT